MAVDAPFANVRGDRSLTPVGGSNSAALISAMDGTLTNTVAIRRQVESSAQDLRIVNERTQRMHSSFLDMEHQSKTLMDSIADAITSTAETVLDRLMPTLDAAKHSAVSAAATAAASHHSTQTALSDLAVNPLLRSNASQGGLGPTGLGTAENPLVVTTADKQAPGATESSSATPPRSKQTPSAPDPSTRPSPAERATTVDQGHMHLPKRPTKQEGGEVGPEEKALNPYEQYQRGQGMSLTSLRQGFGEAIRKAGQESAPPTYVNAKGETRYKVGTRDADGKSVSRQLVPEKDVAKYAKVARMSRIMTNYGGSIAEAGSLGEGIGAALPGALGPIGLAVGAGVMAVNKAADAAHAQREANNQFISVEGGGQIGAVRERARETGFRLRQRFTGGLDAAESDELFLGATRIGLKGEERQGALNFGAENYKKFGMDIASSLELINVAAEHGQTNLSGLSDSLEAVSKAAKDGGVNAEAARKQFTTAYAAAAQQFSDPNAANVVASAQTSALAAQGGKYQNIDASGTTSTEWMLRMASRTGMNINDIISMQGEKGGVKYAQATANMQRQNLAGMLGSSGMAAFNQAKAKVGAPKGANHTYTEEQNAQMVQAISPYMNRLNAQGISSEIGLKVGQNNDLEVVSQILSGNVDAGARAQDQVRGGKLLDAKNLGKAGKAIGAGRMQRNADEHWDSRMLESIGSSIAGHLPGWLGGDHGRSSTQDAYLNQVNKTHQRSRLVESLVKEYSSDKLLVGGKKMSVQDAVKHHLTELERGDATWATGGNDKKGKSIVATTGIEGDADAGKKRDKASASSAVKGSVSLSLDPNVAKWFRAHVTGDVSTSNLPGDAHPAPNARPSGQVPPS